MSLFDQVAALFKARQTKKTNDFDGLVAAVIDGTPPGPEAIAELLEAADKTPDDLQREVTRRQQRRQDAAVLAEVPALQEEAAELKGKGAAESQRFEAAIKPLREAYQQTIGSLNDRYFAIMRQIPVAESMRAKLIATYRGPLEAELTGNREQQAELSREIHQTIKLAEKHEHESQFVRKPNKFVEVVRELGQVVGVVASSTTWEKTTPTEAAFAAVEDPFAGVSPEESEAKKAAAKSLRAKVATMQAELARLVERETAILAEMLQP